jgi:signal transduction histidine kinase
MRALHQREDSTRTSPADRILGKILVVDDDEKSRRLLSDLLEVQGYQIEQAADGRSALEKAATCSPDAIMLDVMMPDLNGVEVCRRLKADPTTAHIPVLMVTALRDREHRLSGIEAGASDFLSKPADHQELQLRVKNAVVSKRLQDQVQDSYHRLLELEEFRDGLVHMIVHDLRSPLMVVQMQLDLVALGMEEGQADECAGYISDMKAEVHRFTEMINSILDVSKLEHDKMQLCHRNCNFSELVQNLIVRLRPLCRERQITVECEGENPTGTCDVELVERVLVNLFSNAIKHTRHDGTVCFRIEESPAEVRIHVIDDGRGISQDMLESIFDKFGQAGESRKRESTGLGLTFSKMAIEAHGGEIGVESEDGTGSRFWFTLPKNLEPAAVPVS